MFWIERSEIWSWFSDNYYLSLSIGDSKTSWEVVFFKIEKIGGFFNAVILDGRSKLSLYGRKPIMSWFYGLLDL